MTVKAPNRIQDWRERAERLRDQLAGKTKVEAHLATEMFTLYNDRFRPEEFSRHCPKCVGRVWKRILAELSDTTS